MTDAPFVIAGWVGTAGAFALYAATIAARTRRAARARAVAERRPR